MMLAENPVKNDPKITFPCLIADIGGSNARFGWQDQSGAMVEHVRKLPVASHATPALAVNAYLQELQQALGSAFRPPRKAAVAVATAVNNDAVAFTNSTWSFSRRQLQAELQLDELLVLNDFEALAWSLPYLGSDQLRPHAGFAVNPRGILAVIGPGTGLGVASVVQARQGWAVLPGEGGHATIAPVDDFESELLKVVRKEYPHVSAERLLSGIGLPVLYKAVCRVTEKPVDTLTAESIVDMGTPGMDASCAQTLDVFCAMLGSFAGNVALTVGARGGVYIGGGIVPRLGERFFQSAFRERFEAKGRLNEYLAAIPTILITDTLAALTGAAIAIEQSR